MIYRLFNRIIKGDRLNTTEYMKKIEQYFDTVIKDDLYSSKGNLRFYLNYIFGDINFKGKTMLDIGGGAGIFSFYAAVQGARFVICLEPEEEGSTKRITAKFNKLADKLDMQNVTLIDSTIQDFDYDEQFDIILLHNSINHLDENACINLQNSESARQTYKVLFRKIGKLSKARGRIIITDCSRYNFFSFLGVKNPFAPTIGWHKHQSPQYWAKMLCEAGFKNPKLKWTSFDQFRTPGRFLLGNRVASFFLHSHFCLTMEKRDK